jgi:peptidoglycan-N-acetylglucosamine deacetylase
MRDGGDRRGAGGPPVTRRVLLAAGGAVLLTGTAAVAAADARAHSAGTQPRPAADGAAGPADARADAPARPGKTPPAASPPARQHPELTRHAARPPRRGQPRLAYGEPMYTVADGPRVVALTIDDGPSPVYTPQILTILRRYGVTASFSMIGQNAAAFPGVAREVAAAGHMIVNHTWNHYNLGSMPAAAVQDEISRATDAIHAATGQRPGMFRAPYGVWPPAVFSCCAHAGLTPLAWSVDPRDWSRPGVPAIVRNIESDTRTGSIILEHDGGGNRSQTVAALKIWLPRLLDAGYQFTTPLTGPRQPGPVIHLGPRRHTPGRRRRGRRTRRGGQHVMSGSAPARHQQRPRDRHAGALTLAQVAPGRQIPAGPAGGTPTSRSGQLRSPRQNRRARTLPPWPARYHQATTAGNQPEGGHSGSRHVIGPHPEEAHTAAVRSGRTEDRPARYGRP